MGDLIFIVVSVVFFALGVAYVAGCARLGQGARHER